MKLNTNFYPKKCKSQTNLVFCKKSWIKNNASTFKFQIKNKEKVLMQNIK